MTNEEAIKKLENYAKHFKPNEEFIMAIKAFKENEKLKAEVEKLKAEVEKWKSYFEREIENEW